MYPPMKMPLGDGGPRAASKAHCYFRSTVYTIKRLLQFAAGALLPFADSLAFALALAAGRAL
jgi:hypothetical protein